MFELHVPGSVTDGRLYIYKMNDVIEAISAAPDCYITMSIEQRMKKGSDAQRGYYNAVIIPMYQIGKWDIHGEWITATQAHEELKKHCNGIDIYPDSEVTPQRKGRTTKTMNVAQRELYHERCRRLIWEYFGMITPLPNEFQEFNLKKICR